MLDRAHTRAHAQGTGGAPPTPLIVTMAVGLVGGGSDVRAEC